jgi:hypothetical protein
LNPDGDAYTNLEEYQGATDPCAPEGPPDADGDGLPDAWEMSYGCMMPSTVDNAADYDLDGLDNDGEFAESADPCDFDSDDDGLDDGDEVLEYGTDPTNADTDGDSLTDGYEIANGLDPLDPNDALVVLEIERSGTNPSWVEVTWRGGETGAFTVQWTAGPLGPGCTWNDVDGPALADVVYNGDESWTWTDKGTDPDMGGLPPGSVAKRYYMVSLE